jgi:hypothetical protein
MVENTKTTLESKIQLFFLGLLSFSFLGTFAFWGQTLGAVFAHISAVCIMGFFGCLVGTIAQSKDLDYWKAFKIGFFIPIITGFIAAFIFGPEEGSKLPLACGGWISLGTGLIIVIYYILKRK